MNLHLRNNDMGFASGVMFVNFWQGLSRGAVP